MKTLLALSLCVVAGGTALQTDYTKPRSLRIESDLTMSNEIVEMSVERDGEPVDMPNMGGGGETTYSMVLVDELLESKDNEPKKLKRHFEKIGGKATMSMGDQTNDSKIESPFEGAVVLMDGTGDEIKFEFESGSEPDHEEALKNHKLTLSLDGLLPDGEVEKDATWDLEKDDILAALGLNMTRTYFPPPQRDSAGGGEGGGGGGRGRGMRGMGSGPLGQAEWEGTAKLVSLDEELDGEKVAKVEIKIEAKGTMEEPQMGGGGRRQRMLEPGVTLPETTYSAEGEGFLYFSVADKRPVKLELEGKNETESNREMTRQESTMKMHTKTAGKFSIKVSIAKEEPKEEKK
jgi:hypothetical protein